MLQYLMNFWTILCAESQLGTIVTGDVLGCPEISGVWAYNPLTVTGFKFKDYHP